MDIDFSQLSANQAYFTMTQAILPRPVAWVLSEHGNGEYNLAPFSYFSAVCSDPPMIMISIGHKPDGSLKDTYRNIVERNNFVVHLAHSDQAEAVTLTARTLAEGESEVALAGLDLVPFTNSVLPRVEGARIALDCELHEVKEIGNKPQFLVFGRVKNLFVDDVAVTTDAKGRMKIAADKVDPLGRLGGSEYVTFGDILHIPREV